MRLETSMGRGGRGAGKGRPEAAVCVVRRAVPAVGPGEAVLPASLKNRWAGMGCTCIARAKVLMGSAEGTLGILRISGAYKGYLCKH